MEEKCGYERRCDEGEGARASFLRKVSKVAVVVRIGHRGQEAHRDYHATSMNHLICYVFKNQAEMQPPVEVNGAVTVPLIMKIPHVSMYWIQFMDASCVQATTTPICDRSGFAGLTKPPPELKLRVPWTWIAVMKAGFWQRLSHPCCICSWILW